METFRNHSSKPSQQIVKRLENIAIKRQLPMATIALSWSLHNNTIPVVGLSSKERIDASIQAIHCKLTKAEVDFLEEPYEPRAVCAYEGLVAN